jgi:DNA-binding transcriptional ArsR family regulator
VVRTPNDVSGDALLAALSALSNPHRLRVIAVLAGGRQYVSQLAREMNMSRPLLTVHLRKLEAAGLVNGSLELSEDGKAMKFYELAQFAFVLTPQTVAEAAKTLSGGDRDA